MINIEFLKDLDRLSLLINKKVTSNYSGERVSRQTGRGLQFKDYIVYAPGEDFRAIDWKVFARTDKLFAKRYEEERNLTVHIIVDFSASMSFGKKRTKADYAAMIGIGFAYMAMKNNERFVLSTFSDKLELFRPKKGKKQLVQIMDRLNNKKPQGTSDLQTSVLKYKELIKTKSLVIIISDFLYDLKQIDSVLKRLRYHDVKLIQVLDPIETGLELEGDFKLRDLETNEQYRTYISPSLRKTYLEQLKEHKGKITNLCNETRARFYSYSTESPIFDTFFELLQPNHAH